MNWAARRRGPARGRARDGNAGRRRDGIAWMRGNPDAWARDSFFAVHKLVAPRALHLALDEVGRGVALFDGPIYGRTSGVIIE